jgi:competence protein ComEC
VADRRAFPRIAVAPRSCVTRLRAPPECAAPILLDRAFLDGHGATSVTCRDRRATRGDVDPPSGRAVAAQARDPAGAAAPSRAARARDRRAARRHLTRSPKRRWPSPSCNGARG